MSVGYAIHTHVGAEGVGTLFLSNPDGNVTRFVDLTTALGTYLLTNAVIDGALVPRGLGLMG